MSYYKRHKCLPNIEPEKEKNFLLNIIDSSGIDALS